MGISQRSSNHRRKAHLINVVSALVLVGLVCMGFVVVQSLTPSAKARAGLPRIATPQLGPNSYAYAPNPLSNASRPSNLLFVRSGNEALQVWVIPISDSGYLLPDANWHSSGPSCRDLSPDFINQIIYCKDADLPKWAAQAYRWSLNGDTLTGQPWVPNLPAAKGVFEHGDFVLLARK